MKMLKIAVGEVIVRIWTAEVNPTRPLGTLPKYDKEIFIFNLDDLSYLGRDGRGQVLLNSPISCILVLRPLGRKKLNGYVD